MRIVKLLILIFIGQVAYSQLSLDSLKEVWYDVSLPNTDRFEAMAKILEHGRIISYYDSCEYYSDLEIAEAKSLGLDKYLAHGLYFRSNTYLATSQIPQAIATIDSALHIYSELNDVYGISICKAIKGTIELYYNQNDYVTRKNRKHFPGFL